jgi:hypothetical protein
MAEDGCTGPEIMYVSGHATHAQVQVYVEAVDQKRMARRGDGQARSQIKTSTRVTITFRW